MSAHFDESSRRPIGPGKTDPESAIANSTTYQPTGTGNHGRDRPDGRGLSDDSHAHLNSDPALQQEVVQALLGDDATKAIVIDVNVVGGIVTLEGKVASQELKNTAGDLAAAILGVTEVRNRLAIIRVSE